jgi:hypothetical protein
MLTLRQREKLARAYLAPRKVSLWRKIVSFFF